MVRDRETVQLRFADGRLVEAESASDGVGDAAPDIEPGAETGYAVEARADALEVNDALVEAVDAHGRTLAFGSRADAEAYAAQLSATDGALRVQAAAPNDPRDVDAYLLAAHDPSIAEPAETDGATWTFDVGANLYGALGEALLLAAPKPHALYYFVRRDLALDDGDLDRALALDVKRGSPISVADGDRGDANGRDADGDCGDRDGRSDGRKTWVPDCRVVARDGWDGPVLAAYYCEVKTGNASFEREQVDVMQALAREERVLKVRVLVDDLPDRYAVRIHEVSPPE